MRADRKPLGERIFFSSDVARLTGVSLRQLQWWDERKVVSPRKEDRRRVYAPEQVLEVQTVAALRRKGLSLQKIRRVLRLLRGDPGRLGQRAWSGQPGLYLITDGQSIALEDQVEAVLNRLTEATRPVYLVCLSDQTKRITTDRTRRYRTRQLPLFETASAKDRGA
jgi:DNA-binding transcriptional MerR regulator